MTSIGVGAALTVLLLFISPVDAGDEFWMEHVTMTCPEAGKWYEKGNSEMKDLEGNKTYVFKYENRKKGLYHCVNEEDTKYYFYVQGKACENCFELDPLLFGLAIIVDVIGTVFVIMIIYTCGKKRRSDGPSNASTAPARRGGRAPPLPSPDYEPLNPHTRNQDPYSTVSRTG
ncbi:T-cell surface glycoprotein CD3 epsilon chain-like isoform X2 [Labrus mixtus]|uniref:T-cell surface glycoprotein CD3 epsilon chain-like isoform X2 n=1 Tax=Labrus mixtus TaxID=508554 RepID=UPI0029C07DA0|nr:T-cell surface glycoprotein CD3 epsilon chain-like isoform X2 [Labrus mixtus]